MIIIDASIIVKWIKSDEVDSEKAKSIYNLHRSGKERILVPQWIFIEVSNYLVTKSRSTSSHIRKLMNFLFSLNLEIYQVQRNDIIEATLLAKELRTTAYDMLYAVVAKKYRTILVTADKRFVEKTKFSHVKLLTDMV